MKPQLTGDRQTGAPQLIWSACSWCPDGRSWHQPGLAGHRTGPDSVESTAETGRHPGGVLGASGETHPAVAVSGGCRAPKHDGVCVCDAPRTPTANKAQRWWRCQPCFSKRKVAGGKKFWAGSSRRVCVGPFLTENGQATFYARISRKKYARYASGVAAPLCAITPTAERLSK